MTEEGRTTLSRVFDRGIEQLSTVLSSATPEELERIEQGMKSLRDVFARVHPDHHGHQFGRHAQGSDSKQ
jgi:flagellin-specific chaperone FliS